MRKRLIFIAVASMAAFPAFAGDVGVSINVGQPGFYGRLDLGDFPRPEVVYAQPVIVERAPVVVGPPIYLRVPPGYERHWDRHCAEYGACGQRVYFVRDNWYNNVYAPRYRERYEYRDEDHERHHEGREERHDERHDEHHDHEEHEHGHGHDHDHDEH